VPIICTLAKAFGVCDGWHASAPCQTWTNRFFTHTGTSLGYVDNTLFMLPFTAPSLFRRLQDNGKSWRVYFHDVPQSILLKDVWIYAQSNYRLFSQFLADAHTGALPNYSFIEPRYFTDLFNSQIPNDEHPPHNVLYGEQLIAQVYNAVRSSPCWKSTLLIITHDEHGGCYDHVPPPVATAPDDVVHNDYGFTFNAYGVRVPAVLISPYIPPGSRIVAPVADDGTTVPFDHTSIIRTVREVFGLGGALTRRDAVAPSLVSALSLGAPNNDGPSSVATAPDTPTPALVAARGAAAPNSMQAGLAAAVALLPVTVPKSDEEIPESVVPSGGTQHATVAAAQAAATACVNRFLGM
jgi:phospholipase C